ncbi:MAG: methyltransferase domain-containing protein [Planctomycetota bacterium]
MSVTLGSQRQGVPVDELHDEFWGGSSLRNIGFWGETEHDGGAASRRLVDEVWGLAGRAGGDVLMLERSDGAEAEHVGADRARRVTVLAPGASPAGLPAAAFDVALCSEVTDDLGHDADLWRTIHRSLRPDGCLVFSCPVARPAAGAEPTDVVALARGGPLLQQLAAVGFVEPEIRDVTTSCWHGYYWRMTRYWHDRLWSCAVGPEAKIAALDDVYRRADLQAGHVLVRLRAGGCDA